MLCYETMHRLALGLDLFNLVLVPEKAQDKNALMRYVMIGYFINHITVLPPPEMAAAGPIHVHILS